MIEIDNISLENEMDIVVAQQHMMRAAKLLQLTLSTQIAISTSVAEISRVVIDRTDTGSLLIGMDRREGKYFFTGVFQFDAEAAIGSTDEKLRYARLLVPEFRLEKKKDIHTITVQIGIPRNSKVNHELIQSTVEDFRSAVPATPYEKLKMRNSLLVEKKTEQEMLLKHTRQLDEKKNDFISTASHELKTPLTTLIAFTQMGLAEAKKNEAPNIIPYLEKINTQAYKLNTLIQQLLNISKIESGQLDLQRQGIEWNNYLNNLQSILSLLVPQHHLIIEQCTEPVHVNIDELRIEQVLTNIVGNAAKYSPAQSSIIVKCTSDNNRLKIQVKDEGAGIDENYLKDVFAKYFREPDKVISYSGFGMGLFISASIIQAHNGRIWVENNEDRGCSFFFTLPVGHQS
ncbi:MAG: ATP-binding protein [Agriterribacter sp.]